MKQFRKEQEFSFRLKKRVRAFFTFKKKAAKPAEPNNTVVQEVEPLVQPDTPVLRPQTASTITEPFPLLSAEDVVKVTSRELTDEEARADGATLPTPESPPAADNAANAANEANPIPTIKVEATAEDSAAAQPTAEKK